MKLFPKMAEEGTYPNTFWVHHHSDIKARQRYHITDEHRCKNPQQNTAKSNSTTTLKESCTMIKWDLFQRCKEFSIFVNQSLWYSTSTNRRIVTIWLSQQIQKNLLTNFNTNLWFLQNSRDWAYREANST